MKNKRMAFDSLAALVMLLRHIGKRAAENLCTCYSDEYSVIISYLPEIPKSRLYFWRNNNSKPDDITPGLMEYDGNWSKLNIMSLPVSLSINV